MEDYLAITASALPVALALVFYYGLARRLAGIDQAALRIQMIYLVFYFAAAPVLHVVFNVFLDAKVADKTGALMRLNLIDALGLIVALAGLLLPRAPSEPAPQHKATIPWLRLRRISLIFIALGTVTYALAWQAFGMAMVLDPLEGEKFAVPIYPFILIECVPMLFGWYFIAGIALNRKGARGRDFWLGLVLVAVTSLVYAGLRGSRVTIVFQVLSYIMFYSIAIRRIGIRQVFIMLSAAIIFNNLYSVFKYGGLDAVQTFMTSGEKPQYVEKYSSPARIFLQDLGRADVQAVIYDRLDSRQYEPPYFPHTFLYGLQLLLPSSLRAEEFASKVELGTIALYNSRPEKSTFSATQIYGVITESALNFGYAILPLAFLAFGALHRLSLMKAQACRTRSDILLYPLYVLCPVYFLFYDFDNIVFLIVKTWLVPFMIYGLCRIDFGRSLASFIRPKP